MHIDTELHHHWGNFVQEHGSTLENTCPKSIKVSGSQQVKKGWQMMVITCVSTEIAILYSSKFKLRCL